jgi:hypothetical protein
MSKYLLCGVALLLAVSVRADEPAAESVELPASVREYLADRYFDGCDPADARIDKAVEKLEVPAAIIEHISANEWEAGQLKNFAADKLHLLVKTPKGETRSITFRNGGARNDRALSPDRERIMRRLYSDAAFSGPEAEELKLARADKPDPDKTLKAAIAKLDDKHVLDADTLKRAADNLAAARDGGAEIAIALAALTRTSRAVENCWAGVWLLSRMDKMNFDREEGDGSINDLQVVDARTFFENVFYATRARAEFPWNATCTDSDFLQQVLSPRGTGEPLQRWRRHYFEALEPELRDLTEAQAAIDLARNVSYDFFRYEGATTWEDFGMLTALAVTEGRCEDCSNVENCMLRAAGFPAAQAITPWWGHQDGNHAWTVIPSLDGGSNGNGSGAAKVYLKTWDKLEDITAVNTEVTDIPVELDEGVTGEKAALLVWNYEEWRVIARSVIEGRKVTFKNVGRARAFVFLVQAEHSADRLVAVIGGKVEQLSNPADATPGEASFELKLAAKCELGEFSADGTYKLWTSTSTGWQEAAHKRDEAGGLSFQCDPARLYRIEGPGINPRTWVARADGTFVRF